MIGLLATTAATAQEATPVAPSAGVLRDYAVRALDDYIRPAAGQVLDAATILHNALTAFCAAPSAELRTAADAAFGAVVTAWAAVIALQIEPLTLDSRRERFFFWPDPRGITLRQVQEIVGARDPTATDAATLAGKSAAIQGLGALEYLLFGSGSETLLAGGEDGRFRCAYAVAIGGNLVAIADALAIDVAPGSPFAAAIATPGPGNALFPAETDAAADFALSIVTAVELARDRILVTALGTADEIGQPRATPLWRSGLTLPFAASLLESAARFVDAAGTAAALPADQAWLPEQIRSETDRAVAALPDAGIEAAVTDPDLRRRTTLARVIVDNVRTLLGVSLPAALGVTLGFNALDGDG
ncbi:MAG: imelysin family protein [Bauldia sp.]